MMYIINKLDKSINLLIYPYYFRALVPIGVIGIFSLKDKIMKKIRLTQGQFALVDDEDFEEINKHYWYANYDPSTNGYYAGRKDYTTGKCVALLMHRVIMKTPRGMHTDHINHNTLDNRRCNLRVCTYSQNHMNSKMNVKNTSGYTGVCFIKKSGKWKASIKSNNANIYLGKFELKEDAIKARKEGERKYFKEFAYKKKVR